MLEQAFPQMSEISVRIALRRHTFINLDDMHVVPGHIFLGEIAKHNPRGFAATHCHHKFAASLYRFSCFFSDELRSFSRDSISIGIDFGLHQAASLATKNAFFSPGLLQPPGGVTRERIADRGSIQLSRPRLSER